MNHFRDVRLLLDEQADKIYAATDAIAEHVRKLGASTLHSVGDISRRQRLHGSDVEYLTPIQMLKELPDDNPWLGDEERPGMADLRPIVLESDGYRCCQCGEAVSARTAQVDHLKSVCRFKRPVDANRLENLQTLCIPCHEQKTGLFHQGESRMQ